MARRRTIAALGSVAVAAGLFRRALTSGWLGRQERHACGVLHGAWYRLRGGHPDEDVVDLVLADRIRSTLGPLERRLDLPHIHVMVQGHTAVLHGDVATESDRAVLEEAVRKVYGVHEVESHLHVGLLPNDTRPSQGRAVVRPSGALVALEEAARRGGASGPADQAIRAVLGTFLGRIPPGERRQVLSHLPADVRVLATSGDDEEAAESGLRTVHALLDAVAVRDPSLDRNRARGVTEAILAELAVLVPEERSDISAVLPRELQELWEQAGPAVDTAAPQR